MSKVSVSTIGNLGGDPELPVAASHLTDEDAKHLKDKIGEMLLQLSIHSVDKYFEACDNCYDFINSLKETK